MSRTGAAGPAHPLLSSSMELTGMHSGPPMVVHDRGGCAGGFCCIHNPSDHPLNGRPLLWDRRWRAMRRICEHDQAHPDPDDIAWRTRMFDWHRPPIELVLHAEVCDGCCAG